MKKICVFTAFSGYDSQMMAFRRLEPLFPGIEIDLVGWCEIDESAIQSHNAVFPEYAGRHYADIRTVPWEDVPDFDILTISSCCQDITRNGNQRGLDKGSGTRSSLLWEVLKGIKIKRPKYCILENVFALLENRFCDPFKEWQLSVDAIGYKSCWSELVASDFGIPQNRNRAFMISIRTE